MRSTPRNRFSTPPGAGGRLPLDGVGEAFREAVSQPEDAAPSDPISVPRKAAHPFRGGRSRGWPRPRHRLDAAHRRHDPVAPGWVPLDPDWLTGGDARHHGAADNGAASAGTDSWLNFESTLTSSQSSPRPTDSPSGKSDKSPWVAALEGSATLNKKSLANWKSACQS